MTDETPKPGEDVDKPNWWIDEGIPGTGERPAWLHEKFKSVAELGTSYAELEKRVGQVPEDYDFSKSKYIDPDYAPFQELKEFAKSKRVPTEVMDKVIESMDKYLNEFSIDNSEEIEKLGENAKERLTVLDNWAKANLSEDAFVALTSNLKTAEAVNALDELRTKFMENTTTVPNGGEGESAPGYTLEDVQAEMNNNIDKYKTDPVYRRDLSSRIEKIAKGLNYVDKTAS